MAIVTIVAAGNMTCILAGCNCAIVAGTASADDLGVVNAVCGCPERRVVTVLANVAG